MSVWALPWFDNVQPKGGSVCGGGLTVVRGQLHVVLLRACAAQVRVQRAQVGAGEAVRMAAQHVQVLLPLLALVVVAHALTLVDDRHLVVRVNNLDVSWKGPWSQSGVNRSHTRA